MANHQYNTNNLTPGTVVCINGRVSYSHITRHIEGEELRRQIERERQRGQRYTSDPNKPFTTMTITDAQVAVHDPNNISIAESYFTERLYQTRNNDTGKMVWNFRGLNKGRSLPRVLIADGRDASGKPVYKEIKPEGELANGLAVTLVMRVFATNMNNGVSMDAVIVNEPIRYFSANDVLSQLEAMGITISRLPAEETAPAIPNTAGVTPEVPVGTPVTVPPAAAPTANPFATQAPAAPVAPNPFADPYAVADNSDQPGGIVYNPNDGRY